jgi:ABC-type transport system involved in multi-copper enzyme maturation permease subunit
MVVLAAVLALALVCIKIEDDSLNLFFAIDISLGNLPGILGPEAADMFRALDLSTGELLRWVILSTYVQTLPGMAFLVALIATGGVVPQLMRRGQIDLLCARPVTRGQVVLGNFLGGLVFVALLGAVLVVGSWLALMARGTVLSPIYLLNALVMPAQYAVVYAIAVFFGFVFRSASAAILLTIVVWFLGNIATFIHNLRLKALAEETTEGFQGFIAGPFGQIVDGLYMLLPKIGELDWVSNQILFSLMEDDFSELMLSLARDSGAPPPDWWILGGTSLGLIALLLFASTMYLKGRDL